MRVSGFINRNVFACTQGSIGNMEQLLNEEIEAYEEHFKKVNSKGVVS